MGWRPVAPTLSHHHSALPNDNNRDDYNRGPDFDHRGHHVNDGSGGNDAGRDDNHRGRALDDRRAHHLPAAFDSARHNRPAVPALPTSHDDDAGADGNHPSANVHHHQRAHNDHDGRSFEHCGPDDDKGRYHDLDH